MDVLLVNAPVAKMSRHASLEPPLGLAYIGAVLLDNGYSVSAMDFNVSGYNPDLLEGIFKKETPRILGISATTETYLNGLKIAELAKKVNPEITVVMGGSHPTVMYGEVVRNKSVDVVVRGEGEYAMLELADCIIGRGDPAEAEAAAPSKDEAGEASLGTEDEEVDFTDIEETGSSQDKADKASKTAVETTTKECDLSQIQGIAYYTEGSVSPPGITATDRWKAYRRYGRIKTTPQRPFIEDPDELPFPAKELFPLPLYKSPGNVLTSRGGCPYSCRFCAVNNIWQGKRRFRKPENVLKEVLQTLESGQAEEISFADDVFTLNRKYVMELCGLLKGIKESQGLRWTCATRVDLVDRELLEEMYAAGCYSIQFGVEAGSQRILDVMGKGITLKQVREAVRNALDVGMIVLCSFMFPQPTDTKETIREQAKFMKELLDMGVQEVLSFTTPLPGTYYYYHAEAEHGDDDPDSDELGINITARNWDEYDSKHLVIELRNLNKRQLDTLFEELVQTVGLTSDDRQVDLF